jgi:hypothetical protein
MLNDFDTDNTPETAELTEEAAELVTLYRTQRAKLTELVSVFGSGHSEVLAYSKVVSLTARELLDEHGVDADEVADALDAQAKAEDILNHVSFKQRAAIAVALKSVQRTTVVHREGAYAGSFDEVIGRLPITIPFERRDALKQLVSAKALTFDVRPAKVNATTVVFHQVILTDLGRALLAELEK